MLALLCFVIVGILAQPSTLDNTVRAPPPAVAFNTRSLVPALKLWFENGDFAVEGRGVSRDTVEVSQRYTHEADIDGDGLKFGDNRAGFLSISNVDLRGPSFLSQPRAGGLLFKMRYNFGNHTSFCQASCVDGSADLPPTSCGADPTAYRSYGDEAVLFQHAVESSAQNILLTVSRTEGVTKSMVTKPGCDDQIIYTFQLYTGARSKPIGVWTVYSYYGIWLEDGEDHEIVLTISDKLSKTVDGTWDLLYIDGSYICVDTHRMEDLPYTTTDLLWHCKNSEGSSAAETDRFAAETDLTSSCAYSRFYFGQAISAWEKDDFASQPSGFGRDHLSVTLRKFEVWNYLGTPTPDDPFFCGVGDACFFYRGSPWCRSGASTSFNDLSQIYHRDPVSCTIPLLFAICDNMGTNSDCSSPHNACGADESCCGGVCRDLNSDDTCGDCTTQCTGTNTCCDKVCVDIYTNSDHCYECGNKCVNGECCDKLQGCSGTDRHCSNCGDNCYELNTDGGDPKNFHCCPTPTSSRCVDFLGNDDLDCGACGNACASGSVCCSGKCVALGDNDNCGMCGDVCVESGDGIQKSCCNGVCETLDTDDHCGSCGHNCAVVSELMGKDLHCCDGLCVEWGTDQRSCGCPATDCQQEYNERFGVTTYHCCAGTLPLAAIPQCLDFTREQACGECGNVCDATSYCCVDAAETTGFRCQDFRDQHFCGACDVDCGETDSLSPAVCCSLSASPTDYGCVALGTLTDCNSCGDACTAPDTDRCCPEIGFPQAGVTTSFTCRNTLTDNHYCGATCTDCTEGDTLTDMFCCNGVCTQIDNSNSLCGCEGACTTGTVCCDNSPSELPLPDYHTCKPLQTMTDCSACGDVCADPNVCCPDVLDPTVSACVDITTEVTHCGACGHICLANTETCCDSICTDKTTMENCGACGNACNPDSEFCCADASGEYTCTAFHNADADCGCPLSAADCTIIPPPDENHPGNFVCCKGFCVPSWEHCFD